MNLKPRGMGVANQRCCLAQDTLRIARNNTVAVGANAIGVARVYDTLEALYHDTHEERYKACPLLKRMALRDESFELAAG